MAEARDSCVAYLEGLLREDLAAPPRPDIVAELSIALGLLETALTAKDEALQRWPEDLPQQVAACLEAVRSFAAELHAQL
jgi:hypothetical protein